MSSTNTIINPRPCNYGCGTRIFWDTSKSVYLEVFTKQRHSCPNRSNGKSNNVTQTTSTTNNNTAAVSKPNYYNKFIKQPKPKMSNSLELLAGPVSEIQKKYEILSDIVTEANGKVHGSQYHIVANNNISLVVYLEVPECKREAVKQKLIAERINKIIL